MINITDTPIALLKYHISQTVNDKKIFIIYTKKEKEVRDCLLHSVDYVEEELWPVLYIIKYTGSSTIRNLLQSESNTAYICVDKTSVWKKDYKKSNIVKFISINPELYEHNLELLKYIMTPEAYKYYWNEYCLERFKCSPIKWYNEARYLTFLYKEKEEKFSIQDIDIIYNKVSDTVKPYLQNVFTSEGKNYIMSMSNKEKFVVFIGVRKALIESIITKQKPELLLSYLLFREAFELGTIRLDEGVIILDHILNNNIYSVNKVKYLFGLL